MSDENESLDRLREELRALRELIAELGALTPDRDRLRDDATLFRQLVEHSLGLMCVHDLDGNLLFVNSAAAQALGLTVADGIGWNLRRFLAPSVEQEFDAYLERIRRSPVDTGLMRVVAKDGTEQIWLYRNVRFEEPGMPPRVLGHAQDVTDRVRAEQALMESERRFRLLADTAPVMIWMCDADGRCTFFNQPWLDFTGRSLEEELGDGWVEGVHPADREGCLGTYRAALGARGAFPLEYRLRRADGEYRWILDRGVLRGAPDGVFAGLVGSCVDVTESRQAQDVVERVRDNLARLVAQRTADLERANEQLRAEMRHRAAIEEELARARRIDSLGTLAGGVAHEFNNLLTVIAGRSQFLLERLRADEPLRHDIELIETAAQGAASLTQQLLAFSRRQVLQPRVLSANALITDTLSTLRRLLGERRALFARLDPTLRVVRVDPAQLQQVIINLTANAREAMPDGGQLVLETASVDLDDTFVQTHPGARPGPHARITIRDTGVGMDDATRARIFEPFFTTKARATGSGLGLATVYGIVKQHDGYIEVESAPGGGTTFQIYLPLAEEGVATAMLPSEGAEALRRRATVLLVEDEGGVRELTRDILEWDGYAVLEARDPVEALSTAEGHAGPIDLLLTDVVMPGMQGPELAERLLAARPTLRVLYMSGYAADAIGRHGVLDPAVGFLQKPFTVAMLVEKVREVLGR